VRLLLFSDLHLDAPFAWAGPRAASAWRQRLRDTLVAVADLAGRLGVDALVCGGDLYEHERFTPDTSEFVRRAFQRLGSLPVYLAPGNHDWLGPESMYTRNRWSDNVHVFREDRLVSVELVDGLTLWGAAHRAPANTDGFLEEFRVDRDGVHLALFHGSEHGSLAAQGSGKIPHAPFAAAQIQRAGIHHALLGHYHQPRDAEHFTYPGNPDPLGFGEPGERAAVEIRIESDGRVTRERHVIQLTKIHDLTVDLTGCASQQDVRDHVQAQVAGLEGLARVTLVGTLATQVDLRPRELSETPSALDALMVRASAELCVAYDYDEIEKEPTVRGAFVRDVRAADDLSEEDRRAVLVTGLRAFEGRDDLEAL
jgi:DNA repair exonuclease SbcCD nuclease subunit